MNQVLPGFGSSLSPSGSPRALSRCCRIVKLKYHIILLLWYCSSETQEKPISHQPAQHSPSSSCGTASRHGGLSPPCFSCRCWPACMTPYTYAAQFGEETYIAKSEQGYVIDRCNIYWSRRATRVRSFGYRSPRCWAWRTKTSPYKREALGTSVHNIYPIQIIRVQTT